MFETNIEKSTILLEGFAFQKGGFFCSNRRLFLVYIYCVILNSI